MLSSFVGDGAFSLSASHVFGSKWSFISLDSVTTKSLSDVYTCTENESYGLFQLCSKVV